MSNNLSKPSAVSPVKLDLMLDRLVAQTPAMARLIFALDATASRQPTWDIACNLTADMLNTAVGAGGLEVQLVYYRGKKECRAYDWMSDAQKLTRTMSRVVCEGGMTQIGKVLQHALSESGKSPIAALVFIGDCMEEKIDVLCATAHDLASRGVKAFMFHEGDDEIAEKAFKEIARITGGAYCKFSQGSAQELKELLRAVAAFAAGGVKALGNLKTETAVKLLEQIKK
jgi:hypothetical protein